MSSEVKKILCPVNLRHAPHSHRGYEEALELARINGAELIIMTVAPEIERNLNIYNSRQCWGEELDKFLASHPPGDVSTRSLVSIGAQHREIVNVAKKEKVGLIVMQAANPRVQDYLLGTTASHVVAHAPCSVYIVREEPVRKS